MAAAGPEGETRDAWSLELKYVNLFSRMVGATAVFSEQQGDLSAVVSHAPPHVLAQSPENAFATLVCVVHGM